MNKVYEFTIARPIVNGSSTDSAYIKEIQTGFLLPLSTRRPSPRVYLGFHSTVTYNQKARVMAAHGSRFERHATRITLSIDDAERVAAGLMLAIAKAREAPSL